MSAQILEYALLVGIAAATVLPCIGIITEHFHANHRARRPNGANGRYRETRQDRDAPGDDRNTRGPVGNGIGNEAWADSIEREWEGEPPGAEEIGRGGRTSERKPEVGVPRTVGLLPTVPVMPSRYEGTVETISTVYRRWLRMTNLAFEGLENWMALWVSDIVSLRLVGEEARLAERTEYRARAVKAVSEVVQVRARVPHIPKIEEMRAKADIAEQADRRKQAEKADVRRERKIRVDEEIAARVRERLERERDSKGKEEAEKAVKDETNFIE